MLRSDRVLKANTASVTCVLVINLGVCAFCQHASPLTSIINAYQLKSVNKPSVPLINTDMDDDEISFLVLTPNVELSSYTSH